MESRLQELREQYLEEKAKTEPDAKKLDDILNEMVREKKNIKSSGTIKPSVDGTAGRTIKEMTEDQRMKLYSAIEQL